MEDGSVSPFEPCRVSLGAAWHRENQLPSRELGEKKKKTEKKEKNEKKKKKSAGVWKINNKNFFKKSFEVSDCEFKSFSPGNVVPYGR